jgi:hypothetical protein
VNAPGDVVNAGGDENQAMKFATANRHESGIRQSCDRPSIPE